MKRLFSLKPFIVAIVFAIIASLSLRVIKEHERSLDLSFPRRSQSPITLFVEPDDGLEPIISLIRSANRSIDLACYLLSDDLIIDELIASYLRGIKVRVMLEREPYGRSLVNYKTREAFIERKIPFKWAPQSFILNHEKVIIIDETKVLIMTMNLCSLSFTKNREYGVLIEDPDIVREATKIFEADWRRRRYRPKEPNLVVSPCNSRLKLTTLLSRAKRRIWLQELLLEDREILNALSSAMKRGVDVRVLLASHKGVNDLARERLLDSGVMVRSQYEPYLHAKSIECDGKILFIGSQNLSLQSLDLNREIGIILTNREIILKWDEIFLRDWEEGS